MLSKLEIKNKQAEQEHYEKIMDLLYDFEDKLGYDCPKVSQAIALMQYYKED